MKAETIAKALGGRKAGGGWMARCPAHDDREPSLSITDAERRQGARALPCRLRSARCYRCGFARAGALKLQAKADFRARSIVCFPMNPIPTP